MLTWMMNSQSSSSPCCWKVFMAAQARFQIIKSSRVIDFLIFTSLTFTNMLNSEYCTEVQHAVVYCVCVTVGMYYMCLKNPSLSFHSRSSYTTWLSTDYRIQVSLAELLAADRTNTISHVITLSCGLSSHVSVSFPHLAAGGKTATQSSGSLLAALLRESSRF